MSRKGIRVRALLSLLAVSIVVVFAPAMFAQDWPKFHKDLAQTGYTTAKAPPTNNVLWTYLTDGPVSASPVVVGDRVFIGSADGKMYGLNKYTGAKLWEFATGRPIHSTAAVEGGIVYFLAETGYLYALDAATGAKIWEKFIGDGSWDWSSPAVHNGSVYVASSLPPGILYSFDAATSANKWIAQVGGRPNTMIAVANGKVFVGRHNMLPDTTETLVAVDEGTGAILWTYDYTSYHSPVIGMVNCNGPVVADIDGDTALEVVFGVYNWNGVANQLVVLREANGTEKWSAPLGGNSTSSPAFHNGMLFIGSDSNSVYAINGSTQATAWTFATGDWVWSSPAVSGDGKVCFGSRDHTVYCVKESDGTLVWSYYTGSSHADSSPAISDSILFIGNENRKVYAFSSKPVPVDIKPMSCPNPLNVNEKGVISVAIVGTAETSATAIDPASIRLEGVPPIRWSIEDVATPYLPLLGKKSRMDCTLLGPDGTADLVLKFDAEALIAALGPVADGEVRTLQLTGYQKDGTTAIRGEDVVVIIAKK